MARILLVTCFVAVFFTCAAAQEYDFDSLNAGDESGSKKVESVKGVTTEAQNSLQRQNEAWVAEEEAQRRANEAAAARYRAEREMGNGNRYYDCEYSCRTNGLLYDGTDKFHRRVKADDSWKAEEIVNKAAGSVCSGFKGGERTMHAGETMWVTGLRCNEVR